MSTTDKAAPGALLVDVDGTVDVVDLPAESSLSTMYRLLRCSTVDVVALTDRIDVWLDDDGMFGQPINLAATALLRRHGYTWQPYHGPVLLCSSNGVGESIPLTPDQIRGLLVQLHDVIAEI